ncbi:MAG: hypothetical protein FWG90_08870 [Oscillospiraceae bacterium]|nr:hypothetical protein [Oscillospiraceae bacterium]
MTKTAGTMIAGLALSGLLLNAIGLPNRPDTEEQYSEEHYEQYLTEYENDSEQTTVETSVTINETNPPETNNTEEATGELNIDYIIINGVNLGALPPSVTTRGRHSQ